MVVILVEITISGFEHILKVDEAPSHSEHIVNNKTKKSTVHHTTYFDQ
jgi:hypothetical protein